MKTFNDKHNLLKIKATKKMNFFRNEKLSKMCNDLAGNELAVMKYFDFICDWFKLTFFVTDKEEMKK